MDKTALYKITIGCLLALFIFASMVAFAYYNEYKQVNKELTFAKEANAYKYEALQYADAYICASDSLLDELEKNNLLPDESYYLDDMFVYKNKLDSMYAEEL